MGHDAAPPVIVPSDNRFSALARRQPIVVFFCLAYLLGWIAFLPLVLAYFGFGSIRNDAEFAAVIIIGTSTPTAAALITQWSLDRSFRICRFRTSARHFCPGLLVGVASIEMALVVLPAIVLAKDSPFHLHWSAMWSPAVLWASWSTFLGGPVNEEAGWRGFALPRLQTRFGPVLGSILLGALWAGWHFPMLLIHSYSVPVWAFFLIDICVSILITWGANLARFSIVVPMLMHAVFNATDRQLAAVCQGVPVREPALLYYLIAAGLVATVCILLTRGRLGRVTVEAARQNAGTAT